MVVLDNNCDMLSSNSSNENHYIIPDPITLPPSLDAKNSPLALLAQTCSQIGADSSNTKAPLLSSSTTDRKKPCSTSSNSSTERSCSASALKSLPTEAKLPESRLAFKPYEMNVLTCKTDSSRPPEQENDERKSVSRTSSRKSASASPHHMLATPNDKPLSPMNGTSSLTAMESTKLQVDVANLPSAKAPADFCSSLNMESTSSFKSPFLLSPLGNFFGCNGCPTVPALDITNPTFRNTYTNGAHRPHPALLDSAGCFPPLPSSPSPYLSYTRVKTPTGTEAVTPVCKDPYCFSCRFSMHGATGPCPPGCVQCDQKYSAAAAAAMLMSSPFGGYQFGRPYVCNWMSEETYCGKRFRNPDELLQHLRTHTSSSDPIAVMNHLRYPSGSVNQLTTVPGVATRYHPYSKLAVPVSIGAATPFSAFNPTLGSYYPPYSLYDQRIGTSVNL